MDQRYATRTREACGWFVAVSAVAALFIAAGCGDSAAGSGDAGHAPPADSGLVSILDSSMMSPAVSPNACSEEALAGKGPDAGNDACLGCALQQCCDTWHGRCVSDPSCYDGYLACVRQCFDSSAGGNTKAASWPILSMCDEKCRPNRDDSEPFYRHGRYNNEEPGPVDLLCVLGIDIGATAADDAGTPMETTEACASECFPKWQ